MVLGTPHECEGERQSSPPSRYPTVGHFLPGIPPVIGGGSPDGGEVEWCKRNNHDGVARQRCRGAVPTRTPAPRVSALDGRAASGGLTNV